MAFDGLTIAAVMEELDKTLTGGRIYKIAQPEKDELILTFKCNSNQYRLLISADPSLPLIYLTDNNKPSPATAPAFCMLLRKHLQSAKIISFTQPDFERIVRIEFENLNEMGDLCRKTLVVELMGRYSNIILIDDKDMIIDSIRHVSSYVSSVREVLPGRTYFLPKVLEKKNPLNENKEDFIYGITNYGEDIFAYKYIYMEYTGIAPVVASAICKKSGIEKNVKLSEITDPAKLWESFKEVMDKAHNKDFAPNLFYENGIINDYAPVYLYGNDDRKDYDSMSKLLAEFYSEKNIVSRIRQRSGDIRRVVQNALDRTKKKTELQEKQLQDTVKRDDYRIYGELLNTYGYGAKEGEKSIKVLNYYTNEEISIPLDPMYSAKDNAKRYFAKYNKLKRTYEALTSLIEENKLELMHLESIMASLDIARSEEDLVQIKEELIASGYVRRRKNVKAPKITSKPYHYVTDEGFDIYVGKNNYQNDELSHKFASGHDMWFHVKKAAGSHVILKVNGKEVPDKVFEKAASLAAYYSSVKEQDKVEIDYTEKKNLKKPPASAPGYVIYHTNYSMVTSPGIIGMKLVE